MSRHNISATPKQEMATVCMRYLKLKISKTVCTSVDDWQERIDKFLFFTYAATKWGHRVQRCGEHKLLSADAEMNALEFLDGETVVASIQPAIKGLQETSYALKEHIYRSPPRFDPPVMPAIHLPAFFNLHKCAARLVYERPEYLEALSRNNFTPLWISCCEGHHHVVPQLLKANADPTTKYHDGKYCLSVSSWYGRTDAVKLMLSHKPHEKIYAKLLDQSNFIGRTVLVGPCTFGRLELLELLFQYLRKVDGASNVILRQTHDGHTPIVKFLQRQPEYPGLLRQQEKKGKYPIHRAVAYAQTSSVETLLKTDTLDQLEFRDARGRTPLMYAVSGEAKTQGKIRRLLLAKGANLHARDMTGITALHTAARYERYAQIRAILTESKGREALDWEDNDGCTALDVALKYGGSGWQRAIDILKKYGTRDLV
jgi:ankyrin repeat protein